jgi:hypothetical protein
MMFSSNSLRIRFGVALVGVMLISFLVVFFPETNVSAHSGGTDKYGCHAGSRPYHCHSSLSATDMQKLLQSIERGYLLNGLTVNGKFAYDNKRYKTCAALNRDLLRGVSKSKLAMESLYKSTGQLYALVSPSLYKKNVHLDADKDGVACGLLELENERVPTFNCAFGSQANRDGLTPETAYICTLDSKITGGWLVEILTVSPNATDAVLAEYEGNDSPYPGNQYFIATIKVTNLTGKKGNFLAYSFGAQGNRGVAYDFKNSCGLIVPNDFNGLDIANGESRIGNLCWEVDSRDADSLKIVYGWYSKIFLAFK